jgi:hypothetical protein
MNHEGGDEGEPPIDEECSRAGCVASLRETVSAAVSLLM